MATMTERRAISSVLGRVHSTTALENFQPNPGGQELFFMTDAHEIILSGGNSSGKSFCGVMRGAYHTIPEHDKFGKRTGKTIHPYLDIRIPTAGVEGWISSWSQDAQRDTLEPLFEKILAPYYSKPPLIEDGVVKIMYFEGGSWINCKWQTQKLSSYRGPKKNWVYLDEPHKEQIYKEARARLFRSGGYMWICMTPIVDPHDPLRSEDVLWMRDEIIEPYERNPEMFPLRKVIYVDVEENYQYVPEKFIESMLAGMSQMERAIRKGGSFVLFLGRHCFDDDMLTTIQQHLLEHPEESTPEYGTLEWDDREDDEWKVVFNRDSREFFPYRPSGDYCLSFWEHPVKKDGIQLSPGYSIGVDAAEGVEGGDFTSVYVHRNDNRRIVAALHGHIKEEVLARQLWLLGNYYNDGEPNYNPALLAIEIRNYGAMTQKLLLEGNASLNVPRYRGDRFYYRPTTSDMSKGREYAYAPGWDTNSGTRKFVITSMREFLVRAYTSIALGNRCLIPDSFLIREAKGFVQDKKGKYGGKPDDRLFSMGIANILLDKARQPMIPSEEKPTTVQETDNWSITQNESGIYQVQANVSGIISRAITEEFDMIV